MSEIEEINYNSTDKTNTSLDSSKLKRQIFLI